jgi:hypothetical protein
MSYVNFKREGLYPSMLELLLSPRRIDLLSWRLNRNNEQDGFEFEFNSRTNDNFILLTGVEDNSPLYDVFKTSPDESMMAVLDGAEYYFGALASGGITGIHCMLKNNGSMHSYPLDLLFTTVLTAREYAKKLSAEMQANFLSRMGCLVITLLYHGKMSAARYVMQKIKPPQILPFLQSISEWIQVEKERKLVAKLSLYIVVDRSNSKALDSAVEKLLAGELGVAPYDLYDALLSKHVANNDARMLEYMISYTTDYNRAHLVDILMATYDLDVVTPIKASLIKTSCISQFYITVSKLLCLTIHSHSKHRLFIEKVIEDCTKEFKKHSSGVKAFTKKDVNSAVPNEIWNAVDLKTTLPDIYFNMDLMGPEVGNKIISCIRRRGLTRGNVQLACQLREKGLLNFANPKDFKGQAMPVVYNDEIWPYIVSWAREDFANKDGALDVKKVAKTLTIAAPDYSGLIRRMFKAEALEGEVLLEHITSKKAYETIKKAWSFSVETVLTRATSSNIKALGMREAFE